MNRSTDFDFDQRIADWLEEDPQQAPRAALDTVLAAYPSIPQRPAWRAPWRTITVTTPMRLAAAAILGVLALGGAIYLGAGGRGVVPAPSASPGLAWTPTGSITQARTEFTATLLGDGRVLIVGGEDRSQAFTSAEVYDPATGTWAPAGDMAHARFYHNTALLPDGRVLVAAGADGPTSEIFDPATGTWTDGGTMQAFRGQAASATLLDGRILVAGGDQAGTQVGTAELYDPATGTWTATGDMNSWRASATATTLPDGRVLVVGGFGGGATAELFDPATGTWTATGSMSVERADGQTATLLEDGTVLVTGGGSSTAERYDPATGTWSLAGELASSSAGETATRLEDGTTLIAGGMGLLTAPGSATGDAARFDPETGTWLATVPMPEARLQAQAVRLDDGRVLIVSGSGANNAGYLTSAVIFDPAGQ